MAKKSILFVDDEPQILSALRRMLRVRRDQWQTAFAGSGAEALTLLEQQHFDIIVSDMRMPEMDGAELLAKVRERYPQISRIVLSGHSDLELVMRSVGCAHQYLVKPCDMKQLSEVIERTSAVRDSLQDPQLARVIGGIATLPSLPETYHALTEELRSGNAQIKQLARLIAADPGICAKILQLVNSAFFGLPQRIGNPAQALSILGLDSVAALVLGIGIFEQLKASTIERFSPEALFQHSLQVATRARALAQQLGCAPSVQDDAFTAGLLHDIGRLILIQNMPEKYQSAVALSEQEQLDMVTAENRVLGGDHAQIGAYLLGLWSLPDEIVAAVLFHHQPSSAQETACSALTALHLANALDHDQEQLLEQHYLESLGLAPSLRQWCEGITLKEAGSPS